MAVMSTEIEKFEYGIKVTSVVRIVRRGTYGFMIATGWLHKHHRIRSRIALISNISTVLPSDLGCRPGAALSFCVLLDDFPISPLDNITNSHIETRVGLIEHLAERSFPFRNPPARLVRIHQALPSHR